MRDGVRLVDETLTAARERAAAQRRALPEAQRLLDAQTYPVGLSPALADLRDTLARRHSGD
jgi:hypothetical protein